MKPVECLIKGLPLDAADPVTPMDLTATDFAELIRQGLTKGEIMKLYQFKYDAAYYARLKPLGLHPLPEDLEAQAKINANMKRSQAATDRTKKTDDKDGREEDGSDSLPGRERIPAASSAFPSPKTVNIILRFGDAGNGYFTTVDPYLSLAELVAMAAERGYRSVLIPAAQGMEVPDAS